MEGWCVAPRFGPDSSSVETQEMTGRGCDHGKNLGTPNDASLRAGARSALKGRIEKTAGSPWVHFAQFESQLGPLPQEST